MRYESSINITIPRETFTIFIKTEIHKNLFIKVEKTHDVDFNDPVIYLLV